MNEFGPIGNLVAALYGQWPTVWSDHVAAVGAAFAEVWLEKGRSREPSF
jgi:hypothetical protein